MENLAHSWSLGGRRLQCVRKNGNEHIFDPSRAHACLFYFPSAWTISSVTFLASPNSIIVLGRKNSSLSTPA